MHISTVYLNTYSQERPIEGHFTIKGGNGTHDIKFDTTEAQEIQHICERALKRSQAALAQELLSASILPPALPAPETPAVEDGEFEEVSI